MSCKFASCRGTMYARELCQSHHRQLMQGQRLRPVRPYRPRDASRVRVAGLKVKKATAQAVSRYSKDARVSVAAMVADILDAWARTVRA